MGASGSLVYRSKLMKRWRLIEPHRVGGSAPYSGQGCVRIRNVSMVDRSTGSRIEGDDAAALEQDDPLLLCSHTGWPEMRVATGKV